MAIINVTKSNFEEAVLKSPNTVLLDFWAPWCGPCKMIAPIVEEIAAEDESITVGKINVDEETELAMQFGISSIPTLIVMEGGKAIHKAIGYRSKESVLEMLRK